MSTRTWESVTNRTVATAPRERSAGAAVVPIGRALFASIFILAAGSHFDRSTIQAASDHGVPWPWLLVPGSGLLAMLGGLSVLAGYRARIGAMLLALFLVPVTFTMHAFWTATDPQAAQLQTVMFFKNISLLGGVMLIAYFGSGPYSVDALVDGRSD